jgi:hypothetical protein
VVEVKQERAMSGDAFWVIRLFGYVYLFPRLNRIKSTDAARHTTLYTSSQSANAAPRERERFIRTPLPLTSLDTPRLTSINHAGIIKLIPRKSSTAGIGNFFLRKNLPVSTIRQSANATGFRLNRTLQTNTRINTRTINFVLQIYLFNSLALPLASTSLCERERPNHYLPFTQPTRRYVLLGPVLIGQEV